MPPLTVLLEERPKPARILWPINESFQSPVHPTNLLTVSDNFCPAAIHLHIHHACPSNYRARERCLGTGTTEATQHLYGRSHAIHSAYV